jgi:chromosome partitioning protein
MSAKIISVCNQKGGVGKTTVTMGVAGSFARRLEKVSAASVLARWSTSRRLRVLVVDGDPQGSATSWSANAPEDSPFPATVVNLAHAGKNLPLEVRKMVSDYDVVIIDCPPAVESPVPQAALLISDLAVIPLIPSPIDVAAAAPFIRLVEQVRVINASLGALIVPNMVQKQTKLARGYLQHFQDLTLPISSVQLGLRDSHRKACALGACVQDVGDKEALAEMDGLFKEILDSLGVLEQPVASVSL